MEICRLCLHQGGHLISIFNPEHSGLALKIKQCVSVNITADDDLPTTVCLTCKQKVLDWFSFKNVCLTAQDSFEKQAPCDIYLQIDAQDIKSEPGKQYTCDICSQNFTNCADYLDHQQTHNGQPVFKCDKCEQTFMYRGDLVEHDKSHKIGCPQCGKLIAKSSLKLHLVSHTDLHKCKQCAIRCNSKASLAQHVIIMHTDQKDHICEICGKRFATKTALTVHIKSHSDERQYQCNLCKYAGRTASALYIHMSCHAQDNCVCMKCGKVFKSGRNLTDHVRRVHSQDKRHECPYCRKKFVDKYMLTVHQRTHTGVKPYTCKLCQKAFVRADGLKEHLATHGQRIMQDCTTCLKQFASKKGLTRHNCPGYKPVT